MNLLLNNIKDLLENTIIPKKKHQIYNHYSVYLFIQLSNIFQVKNIEGYPPLNLYKSKHYHILIS
jgi:hypothetical protein